MSQALQRSSPLDLLNLTDLSDAPPLPTLSEVWQTTLQWQPTLQQQTQLQALYAAILAGNQHLNLTRITEPEEFWEKHLWDSLIGIASFLQNADPSSALRVIDIGTGGGFPGLPIAIACPQWWVTLLDSTQKKLTFLQQVQQHLQLNQVRTVVGRAEEIGHQSHHRGHYDLACIRAVGGASVCAEYALPFVKTGGLAILYRGQWTEPEAEQLNDAVQRLGGAIERVEAIATPLSQGSRHLIYLRKHKPTPSSFPRPIGVPAKDPL